MTFKYELDLYHLKMYWQTKNELPMSRLSQVIVLQTDTMVLYLCVFAVLYSGLTAIEINWLLLLLLLLLLHTEMVHMYTDIHTDKRHQNIFQLPCKW